MWTVNVRVSIDAVDRHVGVSLEFSPSCPCDPKGRPRRLLELQLHGRDSLFPVARTFALIRFGAMLRGVTGANSDAFQDDHFTSSCDKRIAILTLLGRAYVSAPPPLFSMHWTNVAAAHHDGPRAVLEIFL
jgi:hypothetical protein